MFICVWWLKLCTGHVQINHGNWLFWVVWLTVAGRVSDWINYHVWRRGKMDKSIVVRWAYVKELAMMTTRERGIEIIKLYMREKCSKGWGKESVYGWGIREKCDQCSSSLTLTFRINQRVSSVLSNSKHEANMIKYGCKGDTTPPPWLLFAPTLLNWPSTLNYQETPSLTMLLACTRTRSVNQWGIVHLQPHLDNNCSSPLIYRDLTEDCDVYLWQSNDLSQFLVQIHNCVFHANKYLQ